MFQVHRSESGQFVLIDPATHTVVVSDDLAAGFTALSSQVQGATPQAPATPPTPPPPPVTRWNATLPWALAAILPFVWIAVLHLSLGQLASELVIGMRTPPAKARPVTRAEFDELRSEVTRVGARTSEPQRRAPPAPGERDEGDNEEELEPLRPGKKEAAPPEAPAPTPATLTTDAKAAQ